MSRGDGRVGGEHHLGTHALAGLGEVDALFLLCVSHQLERSERAVAFVQVYDAGLDPERRERADAADSEQELLTNARRRVPSVEPRGERAVVATLHVGVEQIERDAPHIEPPDLGAERLARRAHFDRDRLAVRVARLTDRQLRPVRDRVLRVLLALDVDALLEVRLAIEEPDGHQWDAEVRGALEVVARQHAETAAVDRQRLVEPELGGKVRDRSRPKHRDLRVTPGRVCLEVAGEVGPSRVRPRRRRGLHAEDAPARRSEGLRLRVLHFLSKRRVPGPAQVVSEVLFRRSSHGAHPLRVRALSVQ